MYFRISVVIAVIVEFCCVWFHLINIVYDTKQVQNSVETGLCLFLNFQYM